MSKKYLKRKCMNCEHFKFMGLFAIFHHCNLKNKPTEMGKRCKKFEPESFINTK